MCKIYVFLGGTGSFRYMAPEVMRNESYNELVDIYSFGIIFWQLLTGIKPYEYLQNKAAFIQLVGQQMERPSLDPLLINMNIPIEIQEILTLSWTDNLTERLTANEILMKLKMIYSRINIFTTTCCSSLIF